MIDPLDRNALQDLLRRPPLRRLLAVLNGGGEETRVVGGAVRNALIGHPVHEVDCATTASPDVVTDRATRAGFKPIPTGIEHGTVTVVVDGEPFEVTTLREDVETDGRRAIVRFGRDFIADAQRRDFTINALAVDNDGQLYDHTDGVADLAARRVRFIGDPRTRIREDYLRILRFFRFHAQYAEGPADRGGLAAAVAERSGLTILSRERIRSEVLKLLVARRAPETIEVLAEHGLLTAILGSPAEFGRFARVQTFECGAGVEPDAVRRLAALAVMTGEDAERLREELRLSNDEHERLDRYAAILEILKTWPMPIGDIAMRRLVAEHGADAMSDVVFAIKGEPQPVLRDEALVALRRYRTGEMPVPVFPLRGADFVAGGIPKGPRIGELLALARQAWLAEGCATGEGAARDLLRRVLEQSGGP